MCASARSSASSYTGSTAARYENSKHTRVETTVGSETWETGMRGNDALVLQLPEDGVGTNRGVVVASVDGGEAGDGSFDLVDGGLRSGATPKGGATFSGKRLRCQSTKLKRAPPSRRQGCGEGTPE
jgi:hypothetical protein